MAEMKWFLLLTIFIPHTSSQLPPTPRIERISTNGTGICKGGVFRYIKDLEYLRGCTVVLGNLAIMLETAKADDFQNLTFRDLKEITDYMVIYRVRALESLGQLFPNLTRIRGERLLNNFALIVYDIPNLREIGLYRLLKIDRGGVIMWGLPQACFVDTIDWKALAPKARRVISLPETQTQCNIPCSCASKDFANKCWNNVICQLFLDGPDAEKCNDQCIGCRKTKNHVCFVCRHYTYNDTCVSKCPLNTIILPDNQYCITNEECIHLDRMVWNGTCIPECPMDYKESKNKGVRSCEPCTNCQKTCRNLVIQSLSSIQDAGRCVYVNGSITIHVQAIPGALSDLKKNLGQIQEIAHYLAIEGSHMLTSLNFLSSLRTIKGEKLIENKYSLKITHNNNLQTLFTPDVLKNLVIKRGTAKIDQNPELCTSKIDEIRSKFLKAPTSLDIPETSNGFRGGCKEITFEFQIRYTSDTSVVIMLSPVTEYEFHYLALYARLPPGIQTMTVPETCNEFEWDAKDISTIPGEEFAIVELDSLQLASTYALCIELYDPIKQRLTRSNLFNFTTPVGIPKPPFIFELVASSSNIVVIRWVNHKEYANHITHYELDVALIEMNQIESNSIDYCKDSNDFFDTYYTRHAFVRRPPPGYKRVCESKCGVLSTVTPGAMIEDYFDICEDDHFQCTNKESVISKNTKFGNYIRTLILNITDLPKDCSYQVSGLAPYSDYKFRLRACSGNQCSRSDRGVVRTFPSRNADKITISSVQVSESGHVTVEWDPPKVNNGPILSYTINVMPRIGISSLIPQSWCVPANTTKMIVKSVITQEYLVTVCVKSLGSSKTCCEWIPVAVPNNKDTKSSWLLLGVVCGILIYISSLVIGWLIKRRGSRVYSDVTALIDSTSFSRAESEILSPGLILSDFVPFHSIPLD